MLVSSTAGFLPGPAYQGKSTRGRRHQQDMTLHQAHPAPGCGNRAPLDVQAWRRCRLQEAGFTAAVAETVAADPRVDLHALLQLVDRGCPPELAVRIVAPLPREVAP